MTPSGQIEASLRDNALSQLLASPEVTFGVEGTYETEQRLVVTTFDSTTGQTMFTLNPGSEYCEDIVKVEISSQGNVNCPAGPRTWQGNITQHGMSSNCGAGEANYEHDVWCTEDIGNACFDGPPIHLDGTDCDDGLSSEASSLHVLTLPWVALLAVFH